MHRDLNDIIPPSRRRSLERDQNAAASDPVRPAGPVPPQRTGMTMDMRPKAQAPVQEPVAEEPLVAVPPAPPERRMRARSGRRFPFGTALIALLVVALCGGVLYAFAGAKVTVTPVSSVATVAADFKATIGQGDLPFQLITVEKTATASVPAESTTNSADPASGKITISNRQTTPQALIKNTRFATASGLIFRIHDSISIPAGGTITVTAYADEAGDKYNIPASTFTIPGLKGSSAFDQVTAKSDAPMTGGFSGTRPSVAQATKDKQYAAMQTTLAAELAKDLAAKIPAGYVLVPGASFTNFTPQTDVAGASGTVALSEKGSTIAAVFPSDALARAVAFKSVGTYNGQPATLKDVQNLKVTPTQTSIAPDATEFPFSLSGNTVVVWTVDPAKIAGAVAAKTRESAEIALKSFPEVDKATLVLRPFWASHFPADPQKIKVTVVGATSAK
ncbi:MAG: hypothetical protein JWL82_228 [Parcubacteria group bacterium]|nr:hypothetical protein [Parcubacteria group bacterium]